MFVKGTEIYRSLKRKVASVLQLNGSAMSDGISIDEVWRTAVGKLPGVTQLEVTSNDSVTTLDSVTEAVLNDEGYRAFSSEIHRTNSGTMVRGVLTFMERMKRAETIAETANHVMEGYEEFIEELPKTNHEDTDPYFLDESLPKSVDEISEETAESIASASESSNENNTADVEQASAARTLRYPETEETDSGQGSESRDSETVDTADISNLISILESSVSDIDLVRNESPIPDKVQQKRWGANIFRSLRNRLSFSLRKSKNSDKRGKGSKKLPAMPRTSINIEEYKNKYQEEVELEQLFESLCDDEFLSQTENGPLGELVDQIKNQRHVKKQLKKALAVGRSSVEFQCSRQLVEAERLLLLSSIKETFAKRELRSVIQNKIGATGRKVDFVTLSNFHFSLCERAINDTIFDYFYVVICSYKNQVHVTPAVQRNGDRVSITNSKITFHDLDEKYEIKVEIFALKIRKNSLYPISPRKEKKSPIKTKLFQAARKLSSRPNSPSSFDFDNEFSRFKSQGFVTFTSSSIQQSSNNSVPQDSPLFHSFYRPIINNFQRTIRQHDDHNVFLVENSKFLILEELKYNSNLLGGIEMNIQTEILFPNPDISGFLTVGEQKDGRLDWNRKWCKVNGFELEFYNYPQQSLGNIPTLVIDLEKCVNKTMRLAERSVCSRPRTIHIEIYDGDDTDCYDDPHYTIIGHHMLKREYHNRKSSRNGTRTYLLSVDTAQELNKWLSEFNRAVSFLNTWRV